MKVSQEKFHAALDSALAIIISKREAGYANDFEKFAGDAVELALSNIYTEQDYTGQPANIRMLIFSVLHGAGKTSEAGLLNAIDLGAYEVK